MFLFQFQVGMGRFILGASSRAGSWISIVFVMSSSFRILRISIVVSFSFKILRNDNNGKSDLHKRVRCITYPASNGRTTTVKVVSASKTPQGCCLKTPSQNYSELLHEVSGNTKTFDQFLLRSSKNLGRGFKKHRSIPPPVMRTTRKSTVYRRRSLEVVMEEDELWLTYI